MFDHILPLNYPKLDLCNNSCKNYLLFWHYYRSWLPKDLCQNIGRGFGRPRLRGPKNRTTVIGRAKKTHWTTVFGRANKSDDGLRTGKTKSDDGFRTAQTTGRRFSDGRKKKRMTVLAIACGSGLGRSWIIDSPFLKLRLFQKGFCRLALVFLEHY